MLNTTKNIGFIQMSENDVGVDLLRLDSKLYVPERGMIVEIKSKTNTVILPTTTAGDFIDNMQNDYEVMVNKQHKAIREYTSTAEMIANNLDDEIGDISIVVNHNNPTEDNVYMAIVDNPPDIGGFLGMHTPPELSNVFSFNYDWGGSTSTSVNVHSGHISSDHTVITTTTKLFVHKIQLDHKDMSEFLGQIKDHHEFIIYKTDDNSVKYDFTVTGVTLVGDVFELDVVYDVAKSNGIIFTGDNISIRWLTNPDLSRAVIRVQDDTLLPPVGEDNTIYVVHDDPDGDEIDKLLVWDIPTAAYVVISRHIFLRELLGDVQKTVDKEVGNMDVVLEQGNREINMYDGANWRNVFSEKEVRAWIASASKFEGVAAETGHTQGSGVAEFTDLAGMMANLTEDELLAFVGHYYTWNGTDGYQVTATDLGGHLLGAVMNTGDWLQLANAGGDVTDPNDPLYATDKPDFQIVHIQGDNLTKQRADGLYSFEPWADGSYEAGSIITLKGIVYKSTANIIAGDESPDLPTSKWKEVDLSGVTSGTIYLGRGDFDIDAATYDVNNNWGMPTNTFPHNRQPHSDDKYIDIDTNAIAVFNVDPATGIVTHEHEYGEERHTKIAPLTGVLKAGDVMILGGGFDITSQAHGEIRFYIKDKVKNTIMAEIGVYLDDDVAYIFPIAVYSCAADGTPFPNQVFKQFGVLKSGGSGWCLAAELLSDLDQEIEVTIRSTDMDLNLLKDFSAGVTHPTWTITQLNPYGLVDATVNYPNDKAGSATVSVTGDILGTDGSAPTAVATYEGQSYYGFDSKSSSYFKSHVANAALVWTKVLPSTYEAPSQGVLAHSHVILSDSQYQSLQSAGKVVTDVIYFLHK